VTDRPDPSFAESRAIIDWLIGPARQSATPEKIVEGLAEWLVGAGVPLLRVRIGQQVANPLISAWGVIVLAVCSKEVAAVLAGDAAVSLGYRTLKGFPDPQEVFELRLPGRASN
jgi:hypothetical protein